MTNDDIIQYIINDEKATMEAYIGMILSKKSEVKMKDLNILKTGYIKGFRHIFHNIKQFFKNCKYAWQRATKGYSDLDLLDLESFYSSVISTSMQQFAEESNGCPGYMPYYEWIFKVKEISNKIATEGYKELGEIIHHLCN